MEANRQSEVLQDRVGASAGEAAAEKPEGPLAREIEAYAGEAADQLPIGGYATMIGAFVGSFATLVIAARAAGTLPERVPVSDIALLGVATHKLTRIVSRERVAIPLRVPFTHYEGTDGAGQVKEEPRGRGVQRAIGSLVTCQYCTGPWIATVLTAGLLFAPRVTRLASSLFAMVAVSDFLHQAYAFARRGSG
ncbi:MAG TPA: DUF1360 domain-containing protein [Polyangiaceae bacterium]